MRLMKLLDKVVGRDKLLAENRRLRMEVMRLKRSVPETTGIRTIAGLQEIIVQLNERDEVQYVNSAFTRMTGLERADVVGKKLSEIDSFPWGIGVLADLVGNARASDGYAEDERSFYDRSSDRDTYLKFKVSILSNKPQILIEDITKLRELENLFERFVSREVLAKIKETGKDFDKGERLGLTTLFADLRGFTAMSEKLEPNAVWITLNEYFTEMKKIVDRYEGYLDKMIGDELMILFGVPLPYSDHAKRAVLVALEMQRAQAKLSEAWENDGRIIHGLGIGINTGEAFAGPVGSGKRASYTAIGHHVNLSRRVCDAASSGQILISSNTYSCISLDDELRSRVDFKSIGHIRVKGITEAIEVFDVKAR